MSASLTETGSRLQRLWWLHDALWYQGVAKQFGFKAANESNREAIKPIAKRLPIRCGTLR